MGGFIKRHFLLKKGMIMAAGLCCIIAITLNSVAMGTNNWILSEGSRNNETADTKYTMRVNYGLFHGKKTLGGQLKDNVYSLTVFCPSGEGVCLVSCGRDEAERKLEFDYLRFGNEPFTCKIQSKKSSLTVAKKSDTLLLSNDNHVNDEVRDSSTINKTVIIEDDQFMKYGLWITTIIFLSLMLACQIIATGLCVLNTVTVPIEAWVGPMGIYCANAAGGLFGLITLSLWGGLYSDNLSKELAVQETILDEYSMSSTGLGFSYWFVFASLLLTISACVFIRFRNVLRKYNNKEVDNTNSAPAGGLMF